MIRHLDGNESHAETESLVELSKCCPLEESLTDDGKTCEPSNLTFEPVFWGTKPPPKEVGIKIGLKCNYGRYRLEPFIDSNDEFKLVTNGSLFVPYHTVQMLSPSEYCLETFEISPEETTVLPLVCFSPVPPENSWKEMAMALYSIGCLISVPFLLMTLIVYCFTPSLRIDDNGKVLCCHVACLIVAYTSLSLVQITGSVLSSSVCVLVAFCIQFSFLASFFWLNVLCFNTWRRLRKSSDPEVLREGRSSKSKKNRIFLYYSIYAWSVPIFFVAITLTMDMHPSVPSSYLKPNFGIETCWFQEDSTALPYFYAPMACILIANLILFILSALSVHKNTDSTPTRLVTLRQVAIETIKQRRKTVFVECLILFLVMGLNWVFEVISWAVGGPPQIWFVTDLFNTLQGVIVFYVFVIREERARQSLVAILKCSKPPSFASAKTNGNPIHTYRFSSLPPATT